MKLFKLTYPLSSKHENLASYGQDICLCLWNGSVAVSSGVLVGAAGTLP